MSDNSKPSFDLIDFGEGYGIDRRYDALVEAVEWRIGDRCKVYPPDDHINWVEGVVVRLQESFVIVDVRDPVDGLLRHTEFPIPHARIEPLDIEVPIGAN